MLGTLSAWGFWTVCFLLWEAILRLRTQQTGGNGALILIAAAAAGGVVAGLIHLPGWAGRVCGWFLPWLSYAMYGVQLVYYDIFGSFLSLSLVGMGGEAIMGFWSIALAGIGRCLSLLLLMAVPLAAFCIYRRRGLLPRQERRCQAGLLAGCVVLITALWVGQAAPNGTGTVDRWVARMGLLTAEALDVRQTAVGRDMTLDVPDESGKEELVYDSAEWNVLPSLDFEALSEREDQGTIGELNRYFARQTPTKKHEYTGMFEGYNLIVICAEAFSPYLVDQELTPALYRLSHEGIVFENFYNSFPSVTTNGEYSLNMGLMPDFGRMSFAASSGNYVPFCLGTTWKQTGAAVTHAYHNNIGTFYNRAVTHSNMGYDFKAINFGLDMETGTPTSDLEMMEKTVDEYIGETGFHAYYMTYSGHGEYSFASNQMSAQNQALVEGIEGSEPLRAYYACQLELERAMEYLLDRLEKAGIAERTVVVLTGDHMPYSLPDEDYAVLAGENTVEPFWEYRNSFICWNGGMKEPMVVDEYCCTQDILPTLLDLFGLDYDSRLLTGRDVLAEEEHVAVLKDGSFLTDRMYYDAVTGAVTWREGAEEDDAAARRLIRRVENQLTVSAAILDQDYYGFAADMLGAGENDGPRTEHRFFTDTEGRWYEQAAEQLAGSGVVMGQNGEAFMGDRVPARAEFLTFMVRALRLTERGEDAPYTDVPPNAWYANTVAILWYVGLLPEEAELRPAEGVTAEFAREILTRVYAYLEEEYPAQQARAKVREALNLQQEEADIAPGQLSRGAVAWLTVDVIGRLEQRTGQGIGLNDLEGAFVQAATEDPESGAVSGAGLVCSDRGTGV